MQDKLKIKSVEIYFDHLTLNLKIGHIKFDKDIALSSLSVTNVEKITIDRFDLNINQKYLDIDDSIVFITDALSVQINNLNFTSATQVIQNNMFTFDEVQSIIIKSFLIENILLESKLITVSRSDSFYLEGIRLKNCFFKTDLISFEKTNIATISNSSFILDSNSPNFSYFQPLSKNDKDQKTQQTEWLKAYDDMDGSRSLIIMGDFERQYFQITNLQIENCFADFGGFDSRFLSVTNSLKDLKINKSTFQNMKSYQNGGCLRFYVLNSLEITSSNFTNCVSNKFGGAIFVKTFQIINFSNLNLQSNSALFGGGISIDSQGNEKNLVNINFKNNTSTYLDNDLYDYTSCFQINQIFEYIPNYFQQNYLLRRVSISDSKAYLIPGSIYIILIDLNFFKNDNSKMKKVNPTTINNIFFGNLYNFYQPQKQLQNVGDISQYLNYEINLKEFKQNQAYLLFQPNSGLKQFKFNFIYGIESLIDIELSSRDCIQGQQKVQFTTLDTSRYMCKYCEAMSANYRNDLFECQQCDSQIFSQCYLNYTLLNQGYWRESLQVDKRFIYKCQSTSQQSCIGGSGFGNELCSEGRIGNECSVCDETSSYWNATYTSNSLYSCVKCDDIQSNAIKIWVGTTLFIMILFLLINSNFKKIQNQIYQHYLLRMHMAFIGTSFTKFGLASVFIKILSFNASLLGFVQNQLEISVKDTLIEQSIQYSSPLQTSFVSINCAVYDIFPNQQYYGIVKLKLYLTLPLLVIPLVLFLPLIRFFCKKSSARYLKYNISFTIIYTLFIVFYNQILSVCLDSLTCRSFGNGEKALQIDLAVPCSQRHQYYIFSLGGLVLYSILVPSYLIYSLISNRNKLNYISLSKERS
ncbi:transmembrane protein, putative (macronuclear) [Tetrahymena thermophila SB210]|uniref:Transmembrane protein, putative n=1 Tax=Tetrahymena thermophila (strain SB210) TaxID=312017 RepID=Q22LW3_TETTS|nr:transmembrane protein, putative [Tetrahymena thermophila SB210]EAR86563.2 transmembrane protein, putative [Tetrahymena thermophila SB210]|eukprot:XP_977257.2 transmembrane protein, putative [Tetrahymena thermophila SB210]